MNSDSNKSEEKNILVTGDFIVDRNILPGQRRFASDDPKSGTRLADIFGGSLLTYSLVNSIINGSDSNKASCHFDLEEPQLEEFVSGYPSRTAYSLWTRRKEDFGWKVEEMRGYGFSDALTQNHPYKRKETSSSCGWIIIDEGNLGFRNDEQLWPDFTGKMVILKCSYPFIEGKLFQRLTSAEQKPKELIIVVTMTNLRKSDVKISKDISWEQTALDTAAELNRNNKLSILLKSDHLIVMFGASGALHFNNKQDRKGTEISLVFDPSHIEGEWEMTTPLLPGTGCCFLAAFSHNLAVNVTNKCTTPKAIENSITSALQATRIFCRAGFSPDGSENKSFYKITDPEKKLLKPEERKFSMAYVPSPFISAAKPGFYPKTNDWSILRGNYLDKSNEDNVEHYIDLACELASKGSKTILFAPSMSFGKIVTFDRREIENYRNIKKLMVDYANNKKLTKPLSIAVFGTPGSGKSFAVKEMSRSFLDKSRPSIMEFNLSQFNDPGELAGAFHAIRDSVLLGNLPIVFWDEFDSDSLKWLRCLLAPMQDGHFQDGKDTHPIGKSIFIFAGGTSSTFENFDPRNEGTDSTDDHKIENFIKVKGPDFVSRIHGYLNVYGPNPVYGEFHDATFPIRRALFIRSGLGLEKDERLDIDYGLLRALLLVNSYKNGARSLDRILSQLKMRGNKSIVRSDLPSDDIIAMNTDLNDFYSKMCDENLDKHKIASVLSTLFHESWMKNHLTDSSFYKEYSMLSNEQRLINLSTAGRISDVLAKSEKFGLDDRYSDKADASDEFLGYISNYENLIKLAEEEHRLWEQEREKRGWTYGDPRNEYFKKHPCIGKKYSELSDKDQEKDKEKIRNYSEFLKGSAFKIVSLEE
jgi:hypothetical protein